MGHSDHYGYSSLPASLPTSCLTRWLRKRAGCPFTKSPFFSSGELLKSKRKPLTPRPNFGWRLSGLLSSGVLGLILLALARLAGWDLRTAPATPGTALLVWLGYINLALGTFNMIPGFPLDGGRVLHAILWWAMDDAERSTRAAAFVGQVIAVLFIGFGILRFFQGAGLGGLWIAFIGWFLLQAAGASYLQAKAGRFLHGLRVADVMSTDCTTIYRSTSVQDFVHQQLLRTGRRCFFVMEDDRLVGLITTNEVRALPAERWPFTTVREVMRPINSIHSVSREMPAIEALEIMGREDVNQLPVTSDDRVQGIVTRAHLLQVLRSRADLNLPPSLPRAA